MSNSTSTKHLFLFSHFIVIYKRSFFNQIRGARPRKHSLRRAAQKKKKNRKQGHTHDHVFRFKSIQSRLMYVDEEPFEVFDLR